MESRTEHRLIKLWQYIYIKVGNNDNDAKSKKNYSTPINDTKRDNLTVNNNNHNHDNWVVEQEIK